MGWRIAGVGDGGGKWGGVGGGGRNSEKKNESYEKV